MVLRLKTVLSLKTLLLDLVWITLRGEEGVRLGNGSAGSDKGLLDSGTVADRGLNRGVVDIGWVLKTGLVFTVCEGSAVNTCWLL